MDEIEEVVDKTCRLLKDDLQANWTLLLASIQQKFGYWLALQYPTDVITAATRLDSILWRMFEQAAGLHIPKVDEGQGVECALDIPIPALRGQSFQVMMARLPIRERGMGLRSMVDTIPPAFLGSLEMCLPFFCGEEGLCLLLEPLLGDIRAADSKSRWRVLLASGSRTGRELEGCWAQLKLEGQECAAYMGEDLKAHIELELRGLVKAERMEHLARF